MALSRLLTLLSILAFGIATALPCLQWKGTAYDSFQTDEIAGWHCLIYGPLGYFMLVPLLAWFANFWLLGEWIRSLSNRPAFRVPAWASAVWAALCLAAFPILCNISPLPGSALWLLAFILAALAGRPKFAARPS